MLTLEKRRGEVVCAQGAVGVTKDQEKHMQKGKRLGKHAPFRKAEPPPPGSGDTLHHIRNSQMSCVCSQILMVQPILSPPL